TTEYLIGDRCCKKCLPGYRLNKECTETTDSVCEPCPADQHQENFNFNRNCFGCNKCKADKGLQYVQNCSSTTKAMCTCQPGKYCILRSANTLCSDCKKYKTCKPGFGVSVQGTLILDMKCVPCPKGTFSDTASSTDPCRPHTDCNGAAALRKGNATSDTVCELHLHTKTVRTTASTSTTTAIPSSRSAAPLRSTVQSVQPSVSEEPFTHLTKSPPPKLYIITGVIGFLVIIIAFILILLCLHKKICEQREEFQLTSSTAESQENQRLLEKREPSSNHSQCATNTDTLTRTELERDPLQPTLGLVSPSSNLSEPMTLMSNIEPTVPQPSIQTQTSSQPSSPQIVTPVTTSPHVNVNITLHIGNGSCRTPAFIPTDLLQANDKLPFGEEEESFSTPQQEDGKQSLMSVQESSSYCTEHTEQESYP
uniref:Tumor necrosis factor receptor superfamily, member 1B n=1 Tax=Amphilophus citrinellus TaxID=61819 RepID=A0A3Q0S1G0_AMPCI